MQFLVIGASGFLGPHLVREIRAAGHGVIGTSRGGHPGTVAFDVARDRLADHFGHCLTPPERWVVVLCASIAQTDRCQREREQSYRVNVIGATRLAAEANRLGAKVVYVSSSWVHSGAEGFYEESSPRSPVNEYGRQKVEVEQFLEREVRTAFVPRLDKLFSDDRSTKNLFAEWQDRIQKGEPLCCLAGQEVSPTFVGDVGRAIVAACQAGLEGVYNVANPEKFSREALARRFLELLGRPDVRIVLRAHDEFAFLDPRPLKTSLDSSRFRRATGLEFKPIDDVMRAFVHNLRAGA